MNGLKDLALRIGVAGMKILYAFLKLLPTTHKAVFLSRQANEPTLDIRLMTDYLAIRDPSLQTVCLCRRLQPNLSYVLYTLRQMYHLATSETAIIDGYCIPVSVLTHKKDLTVIQMWHAMGSMKCFGYAMIGKEEGNRAEVAHILRMHKNYDYVLISSFDFLKDYEEGFRMDPRTVREIPLPRADLLTDRALLQEKRQAMEEQYPRLQGKKNILYAPTFRKQSGERDEEAIQTLVNAIDFDRYNLIYKPHPNSKLLITDPRVLTLRCPNLEALSIADAMISDYSSMIYEAGLAQVPVYLYAYDWEDYQGKRELNLDLAHDVPTLFTGDAQEIIRAIETDRFDREAFQAFTRRNVRIPATSCREELAKLILHQEKL